MEDGGNLALGIGVLPDRQSPDSFPERLAAGRRPSATTNYAAHEREVPDRVAIEVQGFAPCVRMTGLAPLLPRVARSARILSSKTASMGAVASPMPPALALKARLPQMPRCREDSRKYNAPALALTEHPELP